MEQPPTRVERKARTLNQFKNQLKKHQRPVVDPDNEEEKGTEREQGTLDPTPSSQSI